MKLKNNITRREFVSATSKAVAGVAVLQSVPLYGSFKKGNKLVKLAMVGTGHRGSDMWGKSVTKDYADYVEFVGLCDNNPGRLEFVKNHMGVSCPTFTNFEQMISRNKTGHRYCNNTRLNSRLFYYKSNGT